MRRRKERSGAGKGRPSLAVQPENLVKLEVNLLKQPFFVLSTKQLPEISRKALRERRPQIGYEEVEGDVKRVWWVSPHLELGYCGPFDKKVFMLVQQLLWEQGPPFPRYFRLGSLYQLCRRLRLRDAGPNKQLIKEALVRISGNRIYSENTFYLKGEREYWRGGSPGKEREQARIGEGLWGSFTLWQVYGRGQQLPNGERADTFFLELNLPFLSSLASFYVKPIDFEYYESLRNPVAQRLYELLGVKFYGLKDSPYVRVPYTKLCRLLPLTPQRHRSRARQQLEAAHDKLVETGYLADVEWEEPEWVSEAEPLPRRILEELEEHPWELVYRPGPRARRELQQARPALGDVLDEDAQIAFESEGLKAELLAVLEDRHSEPFYTRLARRAVEEPRLRELIFRCLGEVKEEALEGRIRTSKGAAFVDKLKRYCEEWGIDLGLKRS